MSVSQLCLTLVDHVCINIKQLVKHISIHASLLYTSSVNELVKPLNISKPVCWSNATKCYFCNTGSVSQFIKPFNVSKPVCVDNATERNVCNTSDVSQLVQLLNVSKTVCSSNVAKCNICKVSSVSQIAKSSVVSNSVCSNSVAKRNVSNTSKNVLFFNLSKLLMLLNPSVPLMQVILSFVIPLAIEFLILLVIFSQLSRFVNFLMWTQNVFTGTYM